MAPTRALTALLAAVAGLTALTAPAGAARAADRAFAGGTVGGGMALFGTEAVDLGPLAPCAGGGPGIASTLGESAPGFVAYGRGTAICSLDPSTGEASASVEGRAFRLDALREYGGPVVRVGTFSVSCATTGTGVRSSVRLDRVAGIDLPEVLPENHTVVVPGARITANEVVRPETPGGPTSVHALRIRFFPDGGPASGTLTLGTASCTPAG